MYPESAKNVRRISECKGRFCDLCCGRTCGSSRLGAGQVLRLRGAIIVWAWNYFSEVKGDQMLDRFSPEDIDRDGDGGPAPEIRDANDE